MVNLDTRCYQIIQYYTNRVWYLNRVQVKIFHESFIKEHEDSKLNIVNFLVVELAKSKRSRQYYGVHKRSCKLIIKNLAKPEEDIDYALLEKYLMENNIYQAYTKKYQFSKSHAIKYMFSLYHKYRKHLLNACIKIYVYESTINEIKHQK